MIFFKDAGETGLMTEVVTANKTLIAKERHGPGPLAAICQGAQRIF